MYMNFYLVDRFHGFALHGDRGPACRQAHTNFADESMCLAAGNLRNEVVAIHKLQEMLQIPPLYTYITFVINYFVKKHRYNGLSCTYSTPDTNFHWMERDFMG
jgi:hypothetical protein